MWNYIAIIIAVIVRPILAIGNSLVCKIAYLINSFNKIKFIKLILRFKRECVNLILINRPRIRE